MSNLPLEGGGEHMRILIRKSALKEFLQGDVWRTFPAEYSSRREWTARHPNNSFTLSVGAR